MNSRQTKFIEAYLLNPCATKAEKIAGYSAKSAYSIGLGLLKNPLAQGTSRLEPAKLNEFIGLKEINFLRSYGEFSGDMTG